MRSRIGASTFSRTVSEEKSAPSWNITPQRFSTLAISAFDAVRTSVPKTFTLPARGA